jgi:hypothetical protein
MVRSKSDENFAFSTAPVHVIAIARVVIWAATVGGRNASVRIILILKSLVVPAKLT